VCHRPCWSDPRDPPARRLREPHVALTGTDGNAFAVLGICRAAARAAGWTVEQVTEFIDQATAGDYEHLLAVVFQRFEVE